MNPCSEHCFDAFSREFCSVSFSASFIFADSGMKSHGEGMQRLPVYIAIFPIKGYATLGEVLIPIKGYATLGVPIKGYATLGFPLRALLLWGGPLFVF